MKVYFEDCVYKVSWNHYRVGTERGTNCTIEKFLDDNCVETEHPSYRYHGVAVCGKRDNFSRNTGRKVSLAKALRNMSLSRNERGSFWLAYKEQIGNGKWKK